VERAARERGAILPVGSAGPRLSKGREQQRHLLRKPKPWPPPGPACPAQLPWPQALTASPSRHPHPMATCTHGIPIPWPQALMASPSRHHHPMTTGTHGITILWPQALMASPSWHPHPMATGTQGIPIPMATGTHGIPFPASPRRLPRPSGHQQLAAMHTQCDSHLSQPGLFALSSSPAPEAALRATEGFIWKGLWFSVFSF